MSLSNLLPKCVSGPNIAGSQGAALSLAMHCLMVDEGFRTVNAEKRFFTTPSIYAPHVGWKAHSTSEWEFIYTLAGKSNRFKLTVALHPPSGRVFVHASEEEQGDSNSNNIHVLGLQLEKYLPDASCMKNTSWAGVLKEEEALKSQFKE
eukprot:gene4907-34674_t